MRTKHRCRSEIQLFVVQKTEQMAREPDQNWENYENFSELV